MPRQVHTIDAHVAGQPVRLITSGVKRIAGATLAERQTLAARELRGLQRALMLEPRGHRDLLGALLTTPTTEAADAGVLFLDHDGWRRNSLHGLMAVATIAIERRLITVPDDRPTLTFETAGGLVPVRISRTGKPDAPRVSGVAVRGLPSFVLLPAARVALPNRSLTVDIAFGGGFYAIIDAEAAGTPLVRERLTELRRLTQIIVKASRDQLPVMHPQDPQLAGLDGVIFTSPAWDEHSDLHTLVVYADGAADRSPGGEATAAVMAVVDAMVGLGADRPFRQEGPIGTSFSGSIVERLDVAGFPALVPEIEGRAWITGDHTFYLQADDPLRYGFSF